MVSVTTNETNPCHYNEFRRFTLVCVKLHINPEEIKLVEVHGGSYDYQQHNHSLTDEVKQAELEEIQRWKEWGSTVNNTQWFHELENHLLEDSLLCQLLFYGRCHAFDGYFITDGYTVDLHHWKQPHGKVPNECIVIPTVEEVMNAPSFFNDDNGRVDLRGLILVLRVFDLLREMSKEELYAMNIGTLTLQPNLELGPLQVEIHLSYDEEAMLSQQDEFYDANFTRKLNQEEVDALLVQSGYDISIINTKRNLLNDEFVGDIMMWKHWSLTFNGEYNGMCFDRSFRFLQSMTEMDLAVIKSRMQD